MFGGSPLSNAAAATLCFYSFFIFSNNLLFTTSCSWNFRRRRTAMESLGNMVRFPGEPTGNFLPPPPPSRLNRKTPKTKTTFMRKLTRAVQMFTEDSDDDKDGRGAKSEDDNTNQDANPEVEDYVSVESAEMLAVRRAACQGGTMLIDLKDPTSCLCWSLVRRALRHVVSTRPFPRGCGCLSVI